MEKETIRVSTSDIRGIKSSLKTQAKIAGKYNVKNIQSNRFMRDAVVGSLLGVSDMNILIHGWDGFFDDGSPYENKNVSTSAKTICSFGLKLQDTSEEKLNEVATDGVIFTTSFWGTAGEPDFIVIGNTKYVGDQLVRSFNPNTRRTCTSSLSHCLAHGFKIVAVNYDKEQVASTIAAVSPTLGKSITFDDIYTKSDIPALVAEMK